MKKWILYMLSVVLCTGLFSCTTDEDWTDIPSTGKEGEVKVSFVLNIPSSRGATDGSDLDENYYWERHINETDIRAFVFIDGKYQEEVKRLIIDPVNDNQNQIRKITGMISNQYEGELVQLVVLTNMASRGVEPFTLRAGMSQKELYEKLVYKYGNEAWTFSEAETESYIPMWGISGGFEIKPDVLNDAGEIYMYRAIAKIDIKVNDGKGFEFFQIKSLTLCNVPSLGYCASLETPSSKDENGEFTKASYPVNSPIATIPIYTQTDESESKNEFANMIYIPEVNPFFGPPDYFHIQIDALVNGSPRVYKLYMRNNQTDITTGFDIIRNHKYIINIKTITSTDQIKVGYRVNSWGDTSAIDLPEFN